MTIQEPPLVDPALFSIERYTLNINGHELPARRVNVNPVMLEGFEVNVIPKEVVAGVLSLTLQLMEQHGASALGLDLDSTLGRAHASSQLEASMDTGATILNFLAPRTDGSTWHNWIQSVFPSAVAAKHGEGSHPSLLARNEMPRRVGFYK